MKKIKISDSQFSRLKNIIYEEISNKSEEPNENTKDIIAEKVFDILTEINVGSGLNIELQTGNIIEMCCLSKSTTSFEFEVDENTEDNELRKWDVFVLSLKGDAEGSEEEGDNVDLYELNKNIINSSDNGKTFFIKFMAMAGTNKKEFIINNIKNIGITETCSFGINKDIDDEDEEISSLKNKEQAKILMKTIINDPLMKKAFYKQPTLLNLIISAIKGKNPKGTGIGPAKNIVSKYGEYKKRRRRLGKSAEKFGKLGDAIEFKILDSNVEISMDNNDDTLFLIKDVVRRGIIKKTIGEEPIRITINKPKKYDIIIINEIIGLNDVYNAVIEYRVQDKLGKQIKKRVKIKIELLPSEGYSLRNKNDKEHTETKID